MEKKLTAMAELKERLRGIMDDLPSGSNRALGIATAMDLATELLELEKSQIADAWLNAANQYYDKQVNPSTAKHYYTTTYNQP